MKSKLSCALGAILLSTTALASAPEGFYGGIGSGVSFTSVNAQIFSTNGANQGATNILKQKKSIIGRAFLGTQKAIGNKYFLSGEIFVGPKEYQQKTVNIDVVDPDIAGGGPLVINQNVRLTVERSFTLGAEFKFGRHFDEKTAIYASLNINGSNMKISYGEANVGSGSDKKFVVGIAPGVGILHHWTPQSVIKLGYHYESQSKWTTKDLDLSADDSLRARIRNRAHAIVFSFSRFF